MKQLIQHISRQQFALFICCVLLTSLIYSKFALSVCMIALFVLGLLEWKGQKKFPLRFNSAFASNLRHFWEYRPYVVVMLYFFIVLASGLYSDDGTYWLERLRLKIPFLLAPFAFASIPAFGQRQYYSLFYFLLLLLFFSAIDVGIHYWKNFTDINQLMGQGHPMPTPMSHIRYSLLLSLAILGGIFLRVQNFYWKYRWERHLILALTLLLFAFIHILSVRTGLFTLYASLLLFSIAYVFQTGRILAGVLTLLVLVALPLLAYQYVPSFRAKIRYAIYDMEMYVADGGEHYSDSERIHSLQIGLEIGQENPLLGIGAGDLRQEMQQRYAQKYPQLVPKMPHNQLVSVFAGTGILGLIAFCFAFFYPLFYRRNYREPLFFILHFIIFLSFLMENTLETSIGIALYCVLLLFGLNYLSGLTQNHPAAPAAPPPAGDGSSVR